MADREVIEVRRVGWIGRAAEGDDGFSVYGGKADVIKDAKEQAERIAAVGREVEVRIFNGNGKLERVQVFVANDEAELPGIDPVADAKAAARAASEEGDKEGA